MTVKSVRVLGLLFAASVAFVALVALGGCAGSPAASDTRRIYADAAQRIGADRVPVVVVPGILGSKLEESATGRSVWGAFVYGAADADRPDGARLIALPMREGAALADLRDDVVATEALDTVKIDTLGFVRGVTIEAYAGVLKTLGAGNYRDPLLARGSQIDYGGEHFTCFQYAYDWRRDVAESAAGLAGAIRSAQIAARNARGMAADEPLKVDVVAHSMGGMVLRYYLRYGDQPLPEDGSLPELTWAGAKDVRWAMLVGTPSGGSVLSLQQMVNGMNLHPIAPHYRPAVMGTMPAIYQLFPRTRHARVIDERTGEAIDIFDADEWARLDWGLVSEGAERWLRILLPGLSPEARRRTARDHLEKSLRRAEQLHRALDVPGEPPAGTELVLFAGDAEETAEVLSVDERGRLRVAETSPGDGTVTRHSALMDERIGSAWRPRLQSPIAWSQVRFLAEDHVGLTTSPAFTNDLLFLLLEARDPGSGERLSVGSDAGVTP